MARLGPGTAIHTKQPSTKQAGTEPGTRFQTSSLSSQPAPPYQTQTNHKSTHKPPAPLLLHCFKESWQPKQGLWSWRFLQHPWRLQRRPQHARSKAVPQPAPCCPFVHQHRPSTHRSRSATWVPSAVPGSWDTCKEPDVSNTGCDLRAAAGTCLGKPHVCSQTWRPRAWAAQALAQASLASLGAVMDRKGHGFALSRRKMQPPQHRDTKTRTKPRPHSSHEHLLKASTTHTIPSPKAALGRPGAAPGASVPTSHLPGGRQERAEKQPKSKPGLASVVLLESNQTSLSHSNLLQLLPQQTRSPRHPHGSEGLEALSEGLRSQHQLSDHTSISNLCFSDDF